MPDVRVVLACGYVHDGHDERDIDDLIASIAPVNDRGDGGAEYDGLPDDWCWLAGINTKRTQVAAILYPPKPST